ncbi:unnamed protein product [Soboliphyme baturini]|uniref:18S rRNA (pseudouridine-N1)-methyltransferase n=1 Tax=Soboliphyme baturini TaxID=241478 RepID=A0A183IUS7_9BILA|nr:unnamed protein product [Soboliphyme baturini]
MGESWELPSKRAKSSHNSAGKRLIVILEQASLEVAKVGRSYELLSSEKHVNFLKKQKKDPADYRPDITHQCLLMLLDSPLNRSSLLQVYVHTKRNVLIEIHPETRIPRTFDRFAGLMVQLLMKFSIRAADSSQRLLKVVVSAFSFTVIKNPVENYLPVGCKKYSTSVHVEKLTTLRDIVPPEDPVVIVVGAISHGQIAQDYCEETLKISSFPLSAATTCAKICDAFEEGWGIR